ncbi:hypothetical protein MKY91_20495 [Alkalicoccobacillus gibsonii]|uniref:HEPN domain-containing protein n=1 Tax=Alkalicoccobacillus gibsonii TaxID=79881 RepID=A0ABU9VNR0_9BACI
MGFVDDLEDLDLVFEHLESEKYEVEDISYRFLSEFAGILSSHIYKNYDESEHAQAFLDAINTCSVNKNKGVIDHNNVQLIPEFDSQIRGLDDYDLPVIMDSIAKLTKDLFDLDSTNELLEKHNIGFFLERDRSRIIWRVKDDVENIDDSITTAIEELPPKTKTVLKELLQAKEYLKNHDDSRYLKDTLAKAISGLEAYSSHLTGERKIKDATHKLKQDGRFNHHIVRDITSMWSSINEVYPDVRHGSDIEYDLPFEDAMYWIDRIMSQISYLNRVTGIQITV